MRALFQFNQPNCGYLVSVMLFLLVMLASEQFMIRRAASELISDDAIKTNVSNAKLEDSRISNNISNQKVTGSINNGNKTYLPISANKAQNLALKSNHDFLYHHSAIDLVLKNDSSRKYGSMKSQLDRHSYKINTSDPINVPSPSTNSTCDDKVVDGNHDDLKPSESLIDHLVSSKFDDGEGDHQSSLTNENNEPDFVATDEEKGGFADKSSSSNVSEQKVVRELTKILSKGMSGATDQMRLETLENWKRKQRENKIAKDKRSKLFEDLLTAAINSHPGRSKIKGGGGKKANKKRKSKFSDEGSKSLTGLINDPSVDEDLAMDAEGVVQSLQNLVGSSSQHLAGQDDPYSGVEDAAAMSNNDEAELNESGNDSDEKEFKKLVSSTERPLVKQFKKIKQRISQRRKQLDHIKKMFNVELALNPNDGSLMGKSIASSKAKKEASSMYEDDSNLETSGSSQGKKVNKSSKMADLLNYLKENPEILASVMDELSEDTAYPKASLGGGGSELNPFVSSEPSESNFNGLSSRRKTNSMRHHEPELLNWSRSRGSAAQSRPVDMSTELGDNLQLLTTRKQRSKNSFEVIGAHTNGIHSDQPFSQPSGIKTAEALLLESLRERQLMNLARLEKVLAEHQLASSNRSTIYSALNTQHSPTFAKQGDQMIENERNDPKSDLIGKKVNPLNQIGDRNPHQSNEEVVHHFLVMNNSMPTSNGAHIPEDIISNHQAYQKSVHRIPKQNDHQQWATRGQQRYPLQPSYHNENRYNLINQQQQQQQQHQQQQHSDLAPALNRFKDWRDASQSEASSSNARTRLPYNASFFAANDLTSDSSSADTDSRRSTLTAQNGIHGDRIRPHISVRSDDQRGNDARFGDSSGGFGGSSGFRDYADSTITKPGPFGNMLGPQPGYQQSATSSVFMTRSSADQSDHYATAKPAYARDFDRRDEQSKNRANMAIDVERFDKQSNKDDEVDISVRDRPVVLEQHFRHQSAPVDYFSAYKQELPKDDTQLEVRYHLKNMRLHESTERPTTTTTTESNKDDEDDMGAMWAK